MNKETRFYTGFSSSDGNIYAEEINGSDPIGNFYEYDLSDSSFETTFECLEKEKNRAHTILI